MKLQKAQDELTSMRRKRRQADEKEKAMYARMLGSPKPTTADAEKNAAIVLERKNQGQSNSGSSRTWILVASAAAAAIFGVVVGLRYYQHNH